MVPLNGNVKKSGNVELELKTNILPEKFLKICSLVRNYKVRSLSVSKEVNNWSSLE